MRLPTESEGLPAAHQGGKRYVNEIRVRCYDPILRSRVEKAVAERPGGHMTMTSWVMEAIVEKLERDEEREQLRQRRLNGVNEGGGLSRRH